MKYFVLIILVLFVLLFKQQLLAAKHQENTNNSFSVINYNYAQLINSANNKINNFYSYQSKSNNSKLINTINFFLNQNIAYSYEGAIGEGNCTSKSNINTIPCLNIKQDSIYRLDQLDCTTLVQDFLALLTANNLAEFQQNLINISYGAYYFYNSKNYYKPNAVRYLNRNNFIEADFIPINQKSGIISEASNSADTKIITGVIDHNNWFKQQLEANNLKSTVRLTEANTKYAKQIINNFANNSNNFNKIKVSLAYIPKEDLISKVGNNYVANNRVINNIVTPSVVSFVRNSNNWYVKNKPIKSSIGSDLLVSHVAILYKQTFAKDSVIYQNITCNSINNKSNCVVTPIVCKDSSCNEVMMLVASSMYPEGYVYSYSKSSNKYACTSNNNIPKGYNKLSPCNRVMVIPLDEYWLHKNNNQYIYMKSTSLIGINIQKINMQ